MSSSIDIYNQALLLVGASPIVSFEDETTEANVGKIMYASIKKQLLRSYPWRCATKSALLARLADDPVDPQWSIAYAIPDDSIRILDVFPSSYPFGDTVQWTIEGQAIFTHRLAGAIAKYIFDLPEPQMDSHVEMALIAQLAMDISYAFVADSSREGAMATAFASKIAEARTTDRQEGSHKKFRIDSLAIVRG